MNEDYLWDKTGDPDPEIQRLEALLSPLGHKGGALPAWPAPRRHWLPMTLALAASLLIIFGAVWMLRVRSRPAWQVSTMQGTPSITRLSKGQSFIQPPEMNRLPHTISSPDCAFWIIALILGAL